LRLGRRELRGGEGVIELSPLAKIALVLGWFVALALTERLAPAAPRLVGSDGQRLPRNLGLWLGNILINPLIIVPISAAAASFDLWSRPALPWWSMALDFLLLDLWASAWHRANHRWPLLWRFHRVHHLDQFLDSTSAVRFHPGEVLISALARAPLIVIADMPLVSIALFDTLLLLAALFHHSNVRLPSALERALRVVIVTPSHHWVHHHVAVRDTNSNFGTLLTLWDRLFASWSPHQRTPDMRIGAGEERDVPLAALALKPFARL
jgi:sterol desaturase/sphingolipid hydroxylase (fatty acid hydroxylase superfamily)